MVRDEKPTRFFYLDHRTVDARYSIITDTHVTPASVRDSQPYLARLDRQRERFGFHVQAVGLDAGYFTPAVCQGLEDRGIDGVMGYRMPNHKPGFFYKRDYVYDRYHEEYTCPQGQVLPYSTTNRAGYQEFRSDPARCGTCEVRGKCTGSANHVKVVIRHVGALKGTGRRAAPDRLGQSHLQASQGDCGAQLRGCETVARASLCEDAWTAQGGRAVPTGRGGPEHQEDRPAGGTPAGVFMRAAAPSRPPAAAHQHTAGPD